VAPDNPFLQALLAEPDDDTLRLVMADWLDENNQPARAEFIRVQIELARGAEDRAHRRELELRQRDLLIAHDREWVAPLAKVLGCEPGRWGGWVFRRGFVEYFRLSAYKAWATGARLSRLTPVRELNITGGADGELILLWREPWLRSVTHIYGVELTAGSAAAMLESRYLTGLRVLQSGWGHLDKPLRKRFVQRFGHALPSE
jgi:uncharacterized protein (TIGR02996 family)